MINNIHKGINLEELFNSYSFKQEMNINIKQILIDRTKKCTFKFDLHAKDCFTDGKTITIGALNEFKDMNNLEIFILIKALVGHEASHIKWSNFKALKEFNRQSIDLGYNNNYSVSLANILEDGRIERLLCDYLRGYSKYIQYLNLTLIYGDGNLENEDVLTNIFNTILYLAKLGIYPDNFNRIFNTNEANFIKNEIAPLVLKAVSSTNHNDVFDITFKILELISNKFPQIDLKADNIDNNNKIFDNKNPGYNTSEGEKGEFYDENFNNHIAQNLENTLEDRDEEFNSINKEEKNDTNNNAPKDNRSDVREDLNASENDTKTSLLKDLIDKLEKEIEKDFNRVVNDIKKELDNSCMQDNYFNSVDLDNINKNYKSEKLREQDFKYEHIDESYLPYPPSLMAEIKILEKQFKNLLKNNNMDLRNQRKGKIDCSNLWKINTVYDNYIFTKKQTYEDTNYAVYILIDMSGSMDRTIKYKEAMKTANIIEGSLANLDGVKVKTVGFNYKNKTVMKVFKDFDEKKTKTPNTLIHNYTDGCNRDGFAIRVALKDLESLNAKNKLLVVISDGRPTWDGESIEESMTDVKNAVYEGRKSTLIMSILINEGKIFDYMKECYHYMYEDKGTIMVDMNNDPKKLTNTISIYLKKLFKKR